MWFFTRQHLGARAAFKCLPLLLLLALGGLLGACGSNVQLPPAAARLNDAGAQALADGELDAAARRFQLALEYHPGFVEALTNLGLVELGRGNLVRAEQLLRRAARLNEGVAQPHNGLGMVAEARLQREAASKHYREALKVDPGFADARGNLARLFYEDGRYNHALEEYERLRFAAPDRAEGYVGSAQAMLSLGRVDEARPLITAAQAQFGDLPALRLASGRAYLLEDSLDEAAACLLPLVRRADTFAVEALAWLAVVELARAAPAQAVGAARLALAQDPEHALATYALATALDTLGSQDAPKWLGRAADLNPEHPDLSRKMSAAPPPRPRLRRR